MALIPSRVGGREGPASRPACLTTIVIATVVREEAEVEAIAVMIAMFEARHVVAVFVSLGTALQAGECEHANSGGARQRDDALAHARFLWWGDESIRRQ